MAEFFLGVDQGTTGTKGVVVNSQGGVEYEQTESVATPVDKDGRRVQDPQELLDSVITVIDKSFEWARQSRQRLRAIGLSCQRSGVLAWEHKGGRILHPMMSWQDLSTKVSLDKLGKRSELIVQRSGLPVNGHYAGGKVAVLQREFSQPDHCVGMLDTFLRYHLSGRRSISAEDTMAARTMLYSLKDGNWCPELCDLLGVDLERLPPIKPSFSEHAQYRGVPLLACLGDQQAAYLGLNPRTQLPIVVLGETGSVLAATGKAPVFLPGYIINVLYSREAADQKEIVYKIEATTNCCGPVIDLIVNKLKLVPEAAAVDQACRTAEGRSCPVAFLPLGGTAAPDWRTDLPSVISGGDRSDAACMTRACMENIGSFVAENIVDFMAAAGIDFSQKQVVVTGGLSRCSWLVQFIADCTGCEMRRITSEKGSAYGAALAAMDGAGRIGELQELPGVEVFSPQPGAATDRFGQWQALKERVYRGEVEQDEILEVGLT